MATLTADPAAALKQAPIAELRFKPRSPSELAWRRFRKHTMAMVGVGVLILLALYATVGGMVWSRGYCAPLKANVSGEAWANCNDTSLKLQPPSRAHLFGTDVIGRDIFARTIYGGQISLLIGLTATLMEVLLGTLVGVVAAYYGGWVDNLLMRFTDVIYAFPDLLFLIIIVGLLRDTGFGSLLGGLVLIFAALAVVNWVGLARLVRGQVLSLKEKEFIEAARSIGARPGRIMLRHLFPNTLAPIIVALAFSIPGAILGEASLGYLGIGIKPPTPTWGVMINDGFVVFSTSPWPVFLPALCISLVMLAFTFLGDGLRDALDPRMKN